MQTIPRHDTDSIWELMEPHLPGRRGGIAKDNCLIEDIKVEYLLSDRGNSSETMVAKVEKQGVGAPRKKP